MDVHVPRAITDALKLRDIDVLTADEDGSRRLTDPELLDRATALARVLFTRDADLQRRRSTGGGDAASEDRAIVLRHRLRPPTAREHRPMCPRPRAARRGGAARGVCRPSPAPSVALNRAPGLRLAGQRAPLDDRLIGVPHLHSRHRRLDLLVAHPHFHISLSALSWYHPAAVSVRCRGRQADVWQE
jgi:hypothetical protein